MPIRNITLEESTAEQRRAFVTNFLNLEVSPEASDEDVSAAIARAQPGVQTIFVLDEPPAQETAGAIKLDESQPVPDELLRPEEKSGRQAGSLGKNDPRWVINIPVMETEDGSGGRDVIVGVNGRGWQMKRGFDINVPHRVIVALDNAVQQVLRHDEQGDEIRRASKRFPYNVVERPSQAEIDAWLERTGSQFCA